eukprot:Em0013g425a
MRLHYRSTPLLIALQLAGIGCVQSANLTFMFITSFGQFGLNSSGVVPAADMAIRDINSRSGLLPGYRLMYDSVRDSQCQNDIALDAFFQGIQSDPVKLAVIGCGCSVATEPVAAISHHWNISQISYFSASTALSNRSRYKKYFRTNPSFVIEPPAFLSMIKHFGWRRIGFLTQNENVYTTAVTSFRDMLKNSNYVSEIRLFETTSDNPVTSTNDFFMASEDYRVFFLNSYSGPARKIICEAFRKNFMYPKYVWIMRDSFIDNWWTAAVDKGDVNCTDQELEMFLDKAISFRGYPSPENYTSITDAGITAQKFQDEYEYRALQMNYEASDAGGRAYDAVWILAAALNRTMAMVKSGNINGTGCENITGSLVPLELFQYSNEKMGCLIQYNIKITNFTGVSGHIQFDMNGTRIQNLIILKQYTHLAHGNMSRNLFAYLDAQHGYNFNFLPGVGDKDIYADGIPSDGAAINNTVTYSIPMIVVFYTCSAGGEVFALVCLVFIVAFRNKRVVRLSSPALNYIIVVGSMCMYASLFAHLAPTKIKNGVWTSCLLSLGLFTIGYALCFGALLAKMWRVYYIFHNPTTKKLFAQDWHMVLLTMIITGIGVCLLALATATSALDQFVVKVDHVENPKEKAPRDITQNNYILMCYGPSSPAYYLRALIFAYFAVLQILGIMLAFQTRKVKFPGLKDSKFVTIIMYTSSLILLLLIGNAFAFNSYLTASGSLHAIGVLILTTSILALIFIPKMVMLYKDLANGRSDSRTATHRASIASRRPAERSLESELCQRDKEIKELKAEIAVLKGHLSEIEIILSSE